MIGWIVRIASLAALVALIGLLGYKAMQPTRPTTFSVEAQLDKAYGEGTGLLVPVEITNDGTGTVHDVDLVVTDGSREHKVELERIGERETLTVVLKFDAPPRRVEVHIESFAKP